MLIGILYTYDKKTFEETKIHLYICLLSIDQMLTKSEVKKIDKIARISVGSRIVWDLCAI